MGIKCSSVMMAFTMNMLLWEGIAIATDGADRARLDENRSSIVFTESESYPDAVRKLKLLPHDATEAAKNFANRQQIAWGTHFFLAGHEYVFSFPKEKTGFPLTGIYVDGLTGLAREVTIAEAKELWGTIYPRGIIPVAEAKALGYRNQTYRSFVNRQNE